MMLLAAAGLLAAFYFLVEKIGVNSSTFSGMLSVDPFATFFKIVIVLSTIVIVLMSRFSDEVNAEQKTIGEYYFLVLSMCVGMSWILCSEMSSRVCFPSSSIFCEASTIPISRISCAMGSNPVISKSTKASLWFFMDEFLCELPGISCTDDKNDVK